MVTLKTGNVFIHSYPEDNKEIMYFVWYQHIENK